ncbi:peptidase M24 [Prosthecochloris sp. GSB1]|uniref:aminopeptidase P family protein n=1 Tax=Prosthecochloris sp. GSB1 TaxID=281093 RepID=UPI000B8CB360|nr:aminopeptidase P family protein [Prosthecochloris sp. GSB1]ASQ91729.1 peptidase M24 [Prosthecochloris sp. GSB1]
MKRTDSRRLAPLFAKLAAENLDAMLVTDPSVIRWLTGFSGSSAQVLLSPERSLILTDFRYKQQVGEEVSVMDSLVIDEGYVESLAAIETLRGRRLGFQSDRVTVSTYGRMAEKLEGLTLVAVEGFFDEFRMIKSDIELRSMRRAAAISEQVLEKVLPMISTRVTEAEIAAEISYWHRRLGAEGDSFDPIVASGPRSALPHARPGHEKFRPGSMIVMDFGCVCDGYASDQTRTFAFGDVPGEAREIYGIVRDAQQLGLDSARPGMEASRLDGIVREYIASKGYGEAFGHSLGHGVGVEVHENPRLSVKSSHRLPVGVVFTVEPGIYLPGRYGVRIEDTVVMEEGGATPFQRFTKELVML